MSLFDLDGFQGSFIPNTLALSLFSVEVSCALKNEQVNRNSSAVQLS